jgi:hypothetical protein
MIEQKIEKLIEENLLKTIKGPGLAALGGMVGAGLDTYFHGGHNVTDFIKPLTAWGMGGLIGGLTAGASSDKEKKINDQKPDFENRYKK